MKFFDFREEKWGRFWSNCEWSDVEVISIILYKTKFQTKNVKNQKANHFKRHKAVEISILTSSNFKQTVAAPWQNREKEIF